MFNQDRCANILREAGRSDAEIARVGGLTPATMAILDLMKHPNERFQEATRNLFNAPRWKRVLSEAGKIDADIARSSGVAPSTVFHLEEYPNRNFRFDDRKLFFAACNECNFPWAKAANLQLYAMAKEARGDSPDALKDILDFTGPSWLRAVEATSANATLDEHEWTTLAFSMVYCNAEVQASRKAIRSTDKNPSNIHILLGLERVWSDVKERYLRISSELLKRLDEVNTSRPADATWVDILRYDVTVNRVIIPWELSDKGEQALEELHEVVEEIDYFDIFYRFNQRVPKCDLAPFNAVGFASVLGRYGLLEDLWLGRLVTANSKYKNYRKVLNDNDSGPEFDNFGIWARNQYGEGEAA